MDGETLTHRSKLLAEFDEEMAATRRMLEGVPEDQLQWRPHPKSKTVGELAWHVATLPGIAAMILRRAGSRPAEPATKEELLKGFDANASACRAELDGLTDARLDGNMQVSPGVERPVWAVLRGRGLMNHLIHHRGQLSVYLRLLEVKVPGMYGPSVDEK